MKKKIILSLLTLMISASLFIGCKDDTKETKTDLPTEPTAEEQVLLDLCDLYIKCNDFESANALVENYYGENTFFKKSLGDKKPRHLRGRLLIKETTASNCS